VKKIKLFNYIEVEKKKLLNLDNHKAMILSKTTFRSKIDVNGEKIKQNENKRYFEK
jgi:hypothetical protein